MSDLIIEEPPAPRREPTNWAALILRISEEAPDQWVLAGRDVGTSTAANLQRRYHVEARISGSSTKTNTADKLYVKWVTGTSVLGQAGERIRDRRDRAREIRAKLSAKRAKSTTPQTIEEEPTA